MAIRRLSEAARLLLLTLAAAWLLHPFATARSYGGGDALWYAHMLADFVGQERMGIFPIFAGQTGFAFNGAVFPLRAAPLYQHLAALLDLITFRSLGPFALQHLTVIFCGAVGIFGSYCTLCWIAPARRWSATGFAILYLSCPGVLAIIYTQDLYMTWMATALAPFAVYGIVRTFRHDDLRSQLLLGVSLAALWWAHSPVALWFTAIAAASQIFRLIRARRSAGSLQRGFAGACIFILLAQYPFVSVAMLKSPGGHSAAAEPLPHPGMIADNVRAALHGALMPIGTDVSRLSALQLGFSLWSVLLAAVLIAFIAPRMELGVLLSAACLLILLLLPIPGINRFLWTSMPEAVLRITYYWPMQRFYLILAALLAAAGQSAWDALAAQGLARRWLAALLLLACCSWSLQQTLPFIRAAGKSTSTASESDRRMRPENVALMDHAYGLFGGVPPHFSNGVVDPRSGARLLPPPVNLSQGRLLASGSLRGNVDANPGILDLSPKLHLDFGQRYRLDITFAHGRVPGILQCVGTTLFREYLLPSSGERLSFGSGPSNSPTMDLWTTDPRGDDVSLRFIPIQPGPEPSTLALFGSFRFLEVLPDQEPVEVTSLVPFTARVRTPSPTDLETPRMYMPGYKAAVDGRSVAVLRSPDSLVAIPIPAGQHTAVLAFQGSPVLRISYWGSLFSWTAALLCLAVCRRPLRN
jgi:hypothetical protein